MLTLEQLKAHATANPDKAFDLKSCDQCLAADLTGENCKLHHLLADGTPIDPRFAKFTHALPRTFKWQVGYRIAKAIDRLMAGTMPEQVAMDMEAGVV